MMTSSDSTCGICQLECIVVGGNIIQCASCQNQYHFICLRPDLEQKPFLNSNNDDVLLSCPNCFNFESSLDRLNMALHKDWQFLICAAQKEKFLISCLRESEIQTVTSSNINSSVDDFSNDLLQSYGGSDFIAFSSTKDGSCLFNALSLALYGCEDHSKELRVRALIELVLNENEIRMQLPDDVWKVTQDYQETVFECASESGFSDVFTIMALSCALKIGIYSIYPPINGLMDKAFMIFNRLFSCVSEPTVTVYIMWTHSHSKERYWTPNHFVPLILDDIKPKQLTRYNFASSNNCTKTASFRKYAVADTAITSSVYEPCEELCELDTVAQRPENIEICDDAAAAAQKTEEMKMCDTLDSSDTLPDSESDHAQLLLMEDNSNKTQIRLPLKCENEVEAAHMLEIVPREHDFQTSNSNLEEFENSLSFHNNGSFSQHSDILPLLLNTKHGLKEIPLGIKNNVSFIIENHENAARLRRGEKFMFFDDCGHWTNGSNKKHIYSQVDSIFRIVEKKYGKYILKDNKPINRQPKNVIVINYYYSVLKRQKSFKRKIISIESIQGDIVQFNNAIMVSEYIGIFPSDEPYENSLELDSVWSRREQFGVSVIDDDADINKTEHNLPLKIEPLVDDHDMRQINSHEGSMCDFQISNSIPRKINVENRFSFCNNGHFSELLRMLPLLLNSTCGLAAVPSGQKDNLSFIVESHENLVRIKRGEKCRFLDDCGKWFRCSSKQYIYAEINSAFKMVEKRDGKYRLRRKDFLVPQPKNIVTINCHYAVLKRQVNCKKKIIRIKNICSDSMRVNNEAIMVMEYIGTFPTHVTPHGNCPKSNSEYTRTNPMLIDQMC